MTDISTQQKKCPLCSGSIAIHATYCFHCKTDLEASTASVNSRMTILKIILIVPILIVAYLVFRSNTEWNPAREEKERNERILRDKKEMAERMNGDVRYERDKRINEMEQQGREILASENSVKAEVVRGEVSEMKFTIKAQFEPNKYEAMCHDVGEECVLISTVELPLYKPYQNYTVEKLGRKLYAIDKTNTRTGAQWTEKEMRMTYRVQ